VGRIYDHAMEAAAIVRQLGLTPATCGFMRESWKNSHGAALYFLITPQRRGAVHSLDADQIYHFYAGAPLEVAFLTPSGHVERHVLGPFGTGADIVPQLLVPAGTVHGSRTTGEFTLACTTSFSDGTATATAPTGAQQRQMAAGGFE
jgi:predicted cupin superfamily sugar epimerase